MSRHETNVVMVFNIMGDTTDYVCGIEYDYHPDDGVIIDRVRILIPGSHAVPAPDWIINQISESSYIMNFLCERAERENGVAS